MPPWEIARVPAIPPRVRQLPPIAKQPLLILIPFAAVVVAPAIVRTEPLPPIVVLPLLSMLKTVVVTDAVDDDMLKSAVVPLVRFFPRTTEHP